MSARKRALFAIEDDLNVVQAPAGVLHLAFAELVGREEDGSAMAQSLWFAAVNIEAACQRIRATLDLAEPAKE